MTLRWSTERSLSVVEIIIIFHDTFLSLFEEEEEEEDASNVSMLSLKASMSS